MTFHIDRFYRLCLHCRLYRFSQRCRGKAALLAMFGTCCAIGHAAPTANTGAPAVKAEAATQPPLPEHVNAAADDELDAARGGTATTIDTRLAGQVGGNTATNVQTGWNVINGGAFANMTGMPIVVQNTGANVLIQNATVIQLQLQ